MASSSFSALARGEPLGTPVLQVQCGTCNGSIRVYPLDISKLLHTKLYTCNHCRTQQSIELDPSTEQQLQQQATVQIHGIHRSIMEAIRQAQVQRLPIPPLLINTLRQLQAVLTPVQQPQNPSRHLFPGHHHPNHPRPLPPHLAHLHPHNVQGGQRPPLPPHIQQLYLRHRAQQQQQQQLANAKNQGQGQEQQPPPSQEEQDPDALLEEEDDADEGEIRDTFMEYTPTKLPYGLPHPDAVVETASLAAVDPPDITYELAAKTLLVDEARLSALQLEAVVYACQRHEQTLPNGARGGFFIGDGAGVGKGRTIAGLVLENWARGRRRHIWISVGSDLKIDAQRDLTDVGAGDIPVHALNKLPYGKLAGQKINVKEGVIFLTYTSLVSSSDRGMSRFKQLVEWCGKDFDGLIVFDESHKAKNLVPEAGSRPTQVGLKVQGIQNELPGARIVYCSATGASEPRNMGYMVRLGLWGDGHAGFPDFPKFLEAVAGKSGTVSGGNMAALELVAMDMKAQGMYVCRTLSFAGAEFETLEAELEEPVASQYAMAAKVWNQLLREFLYADEQVQEILQAMEDVHIAANNNNNNNNSNAATAQGGGGGGGTATNSATASGKRGSAFSNPSTMVWRSFWGAHQRFFRHMCMAAKVPAAIRMAQEALMDGKCVVIGLQSTGEARTADVIADKGEELDDFVSGPKELLLRLVDNYYPVPAHPDKDAEAETSDSDDEAFENERITEAAAKGALEMRDATSRKTKTQQVRYKEFDSDEDIGATSSEDDSEDEDEDESSQSDSASAGTDDNNDNSNDDGDNNSNDDNNSDSEFDPIQDAKDLKRQQEDRDKETKAKLSLEEQERLKLEKERQLEVRERALEARRAALERKERLKGLVLSLELPANPLDELIDRLGGPTIVAEMTGRKGRLVRDLVSGTVRYEPRNASGVEKGATLEMINVHERALFSDGAKLVAVISEAASAGISLHADRRVPNQRRRVHITLELPWSADKAIQQFGRSHRANQAHGPQYRLVFTPLGGEKRFAAAVARRLESLGALTQGDRRAGPSLAEFNYESTWGQRALRETYAMLLTDKFIPPAILPIDCRPGPDGEPPKQPLPHFLGQSRAHLLNSGLIRLDKTKCPPLEMNKFLDTPEGAPLRMGTLEDREKTDVPRFLNRLLGLDPPAQAQLFDFYQSTLDDLLENARREGTFDEGIMDLKAYSIALDGEPRILYRDPVSKASTILYSIKIDRGLPWEAAEELLKEHVEQLKEGENGEDSGALIGIEKKEEGKGGMKNAPDGIGIKRRRDETEEKEEDDNDNEKKKKKLPLSKRPKSENKEKEDDDEEEDADNNKEEDEDANEKEEEEEQEDDTDDEDGSSQQKKKKKKSTAKTPTVWKSGFYRTRQFGHSNRVYILLALEIPATSPQPSFLLYRPGTGKNRKPLTLAGLKEKYYPLTVSAAKPLWNAAHTTAGEPGKDGKPSTRHRSVHILGGAVMQSYGAVQRSMMRYVKGNERRMRVMRIATTGDDSQRLVGMFVPEPAVKSVVEELEGLEAKKNAEKKVEEEEKKEKEKKEKEKKTEEEAKRGREQQDTLLKGKDKMDVDENDKEELVNNTGKEIDTTDIDEDEDELPPAMSDDDTKRTTRSGKNNNNKALPSSANERRMTRRNKK